MSVNSPATELTARLMDKVKLRIRVRSGYGYSVSVDDNNSGAGELVDKYQKL